MRRVWWAAAGRGMQVGWKRFWQGKVGRVVGVKSGKSKVEYIKIWEEEND